MTLRFGSVKVTGNMKKPWGKNQTEMVWEKNVKLGSKNSAYRQLFEEVLLWRGIKNEAAAQGEYGVMRKFCWFVFFFREKILEHVCRLLEMIQ